MVTLRPKNLIMKPLVRWADEMDVERIEVCGGIASGKTTLCKKIQGENIHTEYEDFETNPFLKKFYADPTTYGFETEISFLLQHCAQIKAVRNFRRIACDFSIIQDIAYADINLVGKRHGLFSALADELIGEVGHPTHIIHLVCPAEVLQSRIADRKRDVEQNISLRYLGLLNDAISNHIKMYSKKASIITIDSNLIDFRYDIAALPEVVRLLK